MLDASAWSITCPSCIVSTPGGRGEGEGEVQGLGKAQDRFKLHKKRRLTRKLEKVMRACEIPSTRGAKKNSNSLLSFGFKASTSGPTS